MARTESITYTVPKDLEQNAISIQEIFGWNLLQVQEIYSETVVGHLEDRLDWLTRMPEKWHVVEKTKTNYIRLVFSRELNLPNIDNLRELERQYFAIKAPPYPANVSWIAFGCLGMLTFGLFWIVGILMQSSYNKKAEAWMKNAREIYDKKQVILDEARKY